MISIFPSFFRSISHYWTWKAIKAVSYKLADAKMCECDTNIPSCSTKGLSLGVLWLFTRKSWCPTPRFPQRAPPRHFLAPYEPLSKTAHLSHVAEWSCPAVEELVEKSISLAFLCSLLSVKSEVSSKRPVCLAFFGKMQHHYNITVSCWFNCVQTDNWIHRHLNLIPEIKAMVIRTGPEFS